MKKAAALTMALLMCLTMAACGGTSGTDTEAQSKSAETTAAKADEKSGTDSPAEEEKPAETEAPAETQAPETTTEALPAEDSIVPGLTKEEYKGLTAEGLIEKAAIKNMEAVTADEYYWLISTYAYVDIVDDPEDMHNMVLAENVTGEALRSIPTKARPDAKEYIDRLLESEYPQLRGYGMSLMSSMFGVSDADLDRAKALLETEEDPYVLYCAITALSNEQKTDDAIRDFAFRMAESDNPKLRLKAALSCGSAWSEGVEGCAEKLTALMNDENVDVKKTACAYAGGINDPTVIPVLKEILMDPEQAQFHSDAVRGLCDLWWDYPFMEDTNEEAYNVTMEYFKQTPRSSDIPNFSAVGQLKTVAADKYDAWKEKAAYFDTDDLYTTMEDIIKDPDANWISRTAAVGVIKVNCADKFDGLKATIDSLDDGHADFVKDEYEKLAAEE